MILWALFSLYSIWEEKETQNSNLREQIPAAENKIARTKIKLARIKKYKKNLASSEKGVQEVVSKIEKVQKQLPSEINDTEVQGGLSELSEKLKILEASPSPSNEDNHGFYFAKKYDFEAKGTFLQILIFFELLARDDRILNVTEVDLKVSESNDMRSRFQILDFRTEIESYRYNTNYRVKDDVKAQEKAKK